MAGSPADPRGTPVRPRARRVIRHARDFAAVVLLDARCQPPAAAVGGGVHGGAVLAGLPGWIQPSLKLSPRGDFGPLCMELVRFFRSHA
jgi:hypothetical protein